MEGFTASGAQNSLSNLISTASYLGFSSTEPADNGSNVTEPSTSAGYSRVALSQSSSTVNPNTVYAQGHKLTNVTIIYMPEPTADWGTLNYFCLFNNRTSGTPYYVGKLMNDGGTQGVTVNNGYIFFIRPGDLEITLDGGTVTAGV